jgi:hypothetical protein
MKSWLIMLAVLLVGCSHQDSRPVDPPAQHQSYVIVFEQPEPDELIVSVILNINPNHPEVHPPTKRLAIDTGAAHTSFFVSNETLSNLLRMFSQATAEDRVAADGKTVRVCHFANARVTIGSLSADMPIDASAYDMTVEPACDGVLGLDFLSRFNVQIDFQSKTMTLTER